MRSEMLSREGTSLLGLACVLHAAHATCMRTPASPAVTVTKIPVILCRWSGRSWLRVAARQRWQQRATTWATTMPTGGSGRRRVAPFPNDMHHEQSPLR